MTDDVLMTKNVCEGFDIVILKSIPQMLIEFHLHNTSDFMFLFHLTFKDLVNLTPQDNQLEKHVNVLPQTSFKICELYIEGSFSYKYSYSYQKLNPETQVKSIAVDENLTLYIIQKDCLQSIQFELENARPEVVKFELRLDEMNQIKDLNEGKMIHCVSVLPRSTQTVCELSFEGEWSYAYSYKHTIVPEAVDLVALQNELNRQVAENRQLLYRIPVDLVAMDYIASILEANKFTDPLFPPSYISISGKYFENLETQWRRPHEFISGEILLYSNNIKKTKIVSGKLQCHWLMCAMCGLTSHPAIIKNIIENTQVDTHGIYRVYFYKNGLRTCVTIDDFIPCFPGSTPMFTRSVGSELWVVLLEKAYAKLHGSYERLNFCKGITGLIDVTGCPAHVVNTSTVEDPWKSIKKWNEQGYTIIGIAETEANEKFYYCVNRIEIIQDFKLAKLKNPWVDMQVLAEWSSRSGKWTEDMRQGLEETYDQEEGSFWIKIQDFSRIFSKVVLSRIKEYNEDRLRTLILRTPFGGRAKHCFKIEVNSTAQLIIGVHQEDSIISGANEYRRPIDLGVAILKYDAGSHQLHACSNSNMSNREVFVEGTLGPGVYYVVPFSTAASLQRHNREPVHMPLLTALACLHPNFNFTLQDLFNRLCKSNSYELSFEDFEYINTRLELGLTYDKFVSQILNKYASSSGLTFQGLLEFFTEGIEFRGESTVREWMTKLGYDEFMYSIESKPIVLACQSETSFLTTMEELSEEKARLAMEEVLDHKGSVCVQEERFYVTCLQHDFACSFLAVSTCESPLRLRFDFSSAENALFTNGVVVYFDLPPKGRIAFQHLGCIDYSIPFTRDFTYDHSVISNDNNSNFT